MIATEKCSVCEKDFDQCECVLCCEQCAENGISHELSTDDIEQGITLCEKCQATADWHEWHEEILETVEALAAKHEWEFDRTQASGGTNTRSHYYELFRECDVCILGKDDGECTCETLKLRISDHGTAYCTEDISLAMTPSGDDHTLETLEKRLARGK